MSYSNLIFNNSDSNTTLVTQNTPNGPTVVITYAGTGIHTITGPVPLVTISHSTSNDSNDLPEYIRTTIQLEGKIVKFTPSSGAFSGVIGAMKSLESLFTKCPMDILSIKCDSNEVYAGSGMILRDINFQPTSDNWTKTADYSITLESVSAVPYSDKSYGGSPPVTNKVDRWSVEQMDDTFFTSTSIPMDGRQGYEYSNPILGANPSQNINGGSTNNSALGINNIPQFRVTHTVSAKGLPTYPSSTPSGLLDHNPCSTDSLTQMCVKNAKKWVENQLNRSISSGIMPYLSMPNSQFYNHIRSVNIDLSTYEVTDTWLAMNTSIPYIDNYTIESSIDENMVKTVRVVGNIAGLHPFSTGNIASGLSLNPGDKIQPSVTGSSPTSISYPKLDSPSGTTTGSIITTTNKYSHALIGWTKDIKPYLYRRACMVINTDDRTRDYINSTNITSAPENHIYAKDRLLSPTPYSFTEGHDPRKGTISYSAEYRNSLKLISGVVSENIDISYDVPRDEITTISVPGRALGPILSRTGRSASRKTLNINIVVLPPSSLNDAYLDKQTCPLYISGYIYTTVQNIIAGNKPGGISYVQNDNESWSPSQGRYSRSVQWIYQGCNINFNYITGN